MLKYIIAAAIGLLLGAWTWLTLNKTFCDRCRIFDLCSNTSEREDIQIGKMAIVALVVLCMIASCAAAVRVIDRVPDLPNRIRLLVLLIPITAAGMIDLREKRIPNIIPLFITVIGVLFLGYVFFAERDSFESYVVSAAIACFGTLIFLIVISLIAKTGIGAGDIKLLSALGLAGGVNILSGTAIFGTVSFALVAITLLVLKKKTWKSSLPFGPFVLLGYLLTLMIYTY